MDDLYYLSKFCLEETKQELAQVTAEKERLEKEKEEEIVALNNKLHVMDKSYEGIIQVVEQNHAHLYLWPPSYCISLSFFFFPRMF